MIDSCGATRYTSIMIKTWKYKGLKQFYQTRSKSRIQPKHAARLTIILQLLDAIGKADDMNLPGMDYHKLVGKFNGFHSIAVNGNWRVIYQFDGNGVILVDYLDYH